MNITVHKGSTLVEVILAVMILSTCLVLVIQGFVMDLHTMTIAQEYSEAVDVAESALFQILQSSSGNTQFKAKKSGPYNYEWVTRSDPNGEIYLKEAELSIRWPSGQKKRSVRFSTYLLNSP